MLSAYSVLHSIKANDSATPPNMRNLLYKLAHRLVTSSPMSSHFNADRFYLHLIILRELGLIDEARELLNSDIGEFTCATSLVCDEVRRDIWRSHGLLKEEAERARQRIVEKQWVV
jgi:N-terminal acetyltransferase B complex non-catalytic subunit